MKALLSAFLLTTCFLLANTLSAQRANNRPKVDAEAPEFVSGKVNWIFNKPTKTKVADFRGDVLVVGQVCVY